MSSEQQKFQSHFSTSRGWRISGKMGTHQFMGRTSQRGERSQGGGRIVATGVFLEFRMPGTSLSMLSYTYNKVYPLVIHDWKVSKGEMAITILSQIYTGTTDLEDKQGCLDCRTTRFPASLLAEANQHWVIGSVSASWVFAKFIHGKCCSVVCSVSLTSLNQTTAPLLNCDDVICESWNHLRLHAVFLERPKHTIGHPSNAVDTRLHIWSHTHTHIYNEHVWTGLLRHFF